MAASDFRINATVRSCLARRWVDLKKAQVSSFRGTVRVTGEITKLGCEGVAPADPHFMDQLELEIRSLPEVERVYFEITNWRRNETGHWVCLDGPADPAQRRGERRTTEGDTILIFETTGKDKAVSGSPPGNLTPSAGKGMAPEQGANA